MSTKNAAAVGFAALAFAEGFSAGRLFGATFTGVVYEVPGGFDPNARTATP